MTSNSSSREPGGRPLNKQTIGGILLSAAAAPLVNAAIQQAAKISQDIATRRTKPKLRSEAIYRHLDKVRVVGEAALLLENDGSNEERQRIVTDSTVLRDALHEQLAELRLSSGGQKSDVLDAAQAATRDVDRLVAVLSKWALNASGIDQIRALEQAIRAVDASENVLLSCMGNTQRRFKITFPRR